MDLRLVSRLAFALLLAVPVSARGEENAKDLTRRAFDALPKAPFTAKVKVSAARFEPRVLTMHRKFTAGAHATYLELAAPESLVGVRFLFIERPDGTNEQYMKAAFSRTKVLVADEIRRQPFLGSDFYVSDLVLPRLDDFTYQFTGRDTVLGRKCRFVEMTPIRADDSLYSKTILAIDTADLLILGRRFFDRQGRLQKTWTVDKVERIDGIWTLSGQEIADVQQKTRSRLDVESIEYNVELPDGMFTTQYLLR
jgi:hypothetical protein